MVRPGLRLLALALVLIAAAPLAHARITLQLDRSTLTLDESLTATFTVEGEDPGEPDFSPLEQDFEILRRSNQSSLQIINGRRQSNESWVLSLVPKREGNLQIPPIPFGAERSLPRMVRVLPSPEPGDGEAEIFIQIEGSPQPAYVQAQVLYTVRLYLAIPVSNATLSEPSVSDGDAVIEQIGDGRTYEEIRGDKRYTVVERRYAIFPQRSGTLTVEPIVFRGEPRNRRMFTSPEYRRARSEAFALDVLPVPAREGTSPWLPASSLALVEEWPQEPPVFKVGEPVTRTLTLVARGLTAAQLPPLLSEPPPELKQYPDQPQLDDQLDTAGVTGRRREKVALLATQPGTYTLPPVEIAWWNTVEDRAETARLPARQIEVLPGAVTAPPPAPRPMADNAAGQPASPPAPDGSSRARPGVMPWKIASGVLAALWAATLLLWWSTKRRPSTRSVADATPQPAPPRLGEARRAVLDACRTGDAEAVRAALLAWAARRWPDAPPRSLAALARRAGGAFADELEALDRVLYGPAPADWNGAALARGFVAFAAARQARGHGADRDEVLAPLYS